MLGFGDGGASICGLIETVGGLPVHIFRLHFHGFSRGGGKSRPGILRLYLAVASDLFLCPQGDGGQIHRLPYALNRNGMGTGFQVKGQGRVGIPGGIIHINLSPLGNLLLGRTDIIAVDVLPDLLRVLPDPGK